MRESCREHGGGVHFVPWNPDKDRCLGLFADSYNDTVVKIADEQGEEGRKCDRERCYNVLSKGEQEREAKKTENLRGYLTNKSGVFIFQPPSMTFRIIPFLFK